KQSCFVSPISHRDMVCLLASMRWCRVVPLGLQAAPFQMRPPKYQNPGSFGFSFMNSPQVDAQKINPNTPRLHVPKYSLPTLALQPALDFSPSRFRAGSKRGASGSSVNRRTNALIQERGSPLTGWRRTWESGNCDSQ